MIQNTQLCGDLYNLVQVKTLGATLKITCHKRRGYNFLSTCSFPTIPFKTATHFLYMNTYKYPVRKIFISINTPYCCKWVLFHLTF